METIIVTGANGFIASHLIYYLQQKRKYSIVCVDIQDCLNSNYFNDEENLHYISVEYFYNHLGKYKNVSCIFHLGAISSTTERDWTKINLFNVFLCKQLLFFVKKHNISLVFSSSASLYGNQITFKENQKREAHSFYTYSKLRVEEMLVQEIEKKAPIAILRYFNVYGQNESHKKDQASPIFKFTQQAKNKGVIQLFKNSGDYLRDFISVEDVVAITYQVYKAKFYGIANVGTGKAVSFQELAEKIAQKHQAKIKLIDMPENLKKHYQYYTKADTKQLYQIIGDFSFKNVLEECSAYSSFQVEITPS